MSAPLQTATIEDLCRIEGKTEISIGGKAFYRPANPENL
jgi:hypothetical protein